VTTKEVTERRIAAILRRFLRGDEFYTNRSPFISRLEIDELGKLGFEIQTEHMHGAGAGPIAVYPLHNASEYEQKGPSDRGFKEKAIKWLKEHEKN
jgi:hypothetical protein